MSNQEVTPARSDLVRSTGSEPDFLDFERMRRPLPSDSLEAEAEIRERKRKIIDRCNYWLFFKDGIRGPNFANRFGYMDVARQSRKRRHSHLGEPIPKNYLEVNLELKALPNQWYVDLHGPETENDRPDFNYSIDEASTDEIKRIITYAQQKWDSSDHVKIQKLKDAIDDIPQPQRIRKMVCFDLGKILCRFSSEDGKWHLCNPGDHMIVSRYVVALSIAKRLRERTGRSIELYATDPYYDESHKKALLDLGFTILDPAYQVHEPFTFIDDYTLAFLSKYTKNELNVISEYARPVSIICSAPAQHIPSQWEQLTGPNGNERDWELRNILWYEEDRKLDEAPGDSEWARSGVSVPGSPSPYLPDRVYHVLNDKYTRSSKFPAEDQAAFERWSDEYRKATTGRPPARNENTLSPDWDVKSPLWGPTIRMYVRND
ncbi:hypothetical protein F5X99DRAFT_85001 [Biscogniauxia marginata]|nr:hypothetical protein F5X99DRAFT_85001 [Biscogniauxia marginata]